MARIPASRVGPSEDRRAFNPPCGCPLHYTSYSRVLLSLWVVLGLGQLAQSFHRLARFDGGVRWAFLPLIWSVFSFLFVVQTWWVYYELIESPVWAHLFTFLLPLNVFVVLYLICAAALPDVSRRSRGKPMDLGAYHITQRTYFFGLWAILLVLVLAASVLVRGHFAPLEDGLRAAGLLAVVGLTASERRWLHLLLTLFAIGALGAYIGLFTSPLPWPAGLDL